MSKGAAASKAAAMLEMVRKKKEAISAASGRREKTHKPAQGKHVYRILPSWRGSDDPQFWHDFGQHFIKNEKNELKAVYICTEHTFGKECAVCEALQEATNHADSDDLVNTLKEARSKQVYLVNALHRTASDDAAKNTPILLALGQQAFEQIMGIMDSYLSEEGIDITDLEDGVDLVITREGKGFNTKYTVMPKPKSTPVPKSALENLHNLDEYVKQEYEEGQRKALTAIGTVSGTAISAASSAPRLAGPKTSEKRSSLEEEMSPLEDDGIGAGYVDEDDSADTADVEDDVLDAPMTTKEVDDIDALLAGID